MKRIKYSLILALCGVFLWWLFKAPAPSFKEFKSTTSKPMEAVHKKDLKKNPRTVNNRSFSKKDLLHQSRKPAQVRREPEPSMQDFFDLREKSERTKFPKPQSSDLEDFIIGPNEQSEYAFLKNRRAFKLSSEIQRQYPDGFVHLGFWIAKDESFITEELGLGVVYNSTHEIYGVVTGVLKVKMQDMRDQSAFMVSTRGEIFESYDHILATLFKYQQKDALLSAQKFCKQDRRFSLCEIEILERGRFAR